MHSLNQTTTRTPETEARYEALVRCAWSNFGREESVRSSATPIAAVTDRFIGFLYHRYADQSRSSRRTILSALRHWYTRVSPNPELLARLKTLEASWPRNNELPLRTSAQKLTSVTQRELELLCDRLSKQGITGRHSVLWMLCSAYTGLRPREWFRVRIRREREPWLVVQSAKNTNGRSCGAVRELNLGNLQLEELDLLEEFVLLVNECQTLQDFSRFQHRVQAAIRKANKQVFARRYRRLHVPREVNRSSKAGKHPTLYTLRHVVAAALKASDRSRREIAAVLGHGSTYTAARHYARASSGGWTVNIAAHPANLALVNDNYQPLFLNEINSTQGDCSDTQNEAEN